MFGQRFVRNFPESAFMEGTERPVGGFQQFRLQFRAVLLQIQRDTRLQSHPPVAIGQHNGFATARLGDEFAELALSFQNGNRFHVGTLIFGTKSCKRLDAANPQLSDNRR